MFAADIVGGTNAVVRAVRGMATGKQDPGGSGRSPIVVETPEGSIEVVDDLFSLLDWQDKDLRDEEPLAAFVAFLRECPPEAFRGVVDTLRTLPVNASIWARTLGVAAERPGVADTVLWALATVPRFIAIPGLSRDCITFLAAVYGSRLIESRAAFETAALDGSLYPTGEDADQWRSVLERFLSSVAQHELATPRMLALRAEMEASETLRGNEPHVRVRSRWLPNDDVVSRLLESGGADLHKSPERELRELSRKVELRVRPDAKDVDASALAALWHDIQALVAGLDNGARNGAHSELLHAGWGAVSNGVELLAKSASYTPDVGGMPSLDALLELIGRLSSSQYPESSDSTSRHTAWGNWDVRVYGASSLVALAPRFADGRREIVDRMEACLQDPAPTVRLQVAQSINLLWNIDRDRMWSIMRDTAARETHDGVLHFFVAGPMQRLCRADPARCTALLPPILERLWTTKPSDISPDSDGEAAGASAELAAILFVAHDQSGAWNWIDRWAGDLPRGATYLGSVLRNLRHVFFFAYEDKATAERLSMAHRAKRVADVIVRAAGTTLAHMQPALRGVADTGTSVDDRQRYVSALGLLDEACNQLYFGSGAFDSEGNREAHIGLRGTSAKARFLTDYGDVLDTIAAYAEPSTIHHLIDLLTYLVEGDPAGVFDRVAKVLLGAGGSSGYQYESLGFHSLVRLLRSYLADHRSIFEDVGRRQRLVEVLELFSSAGWPDALKLLYELPDLLR